jgi:hypothetical protein
MQEVVKEARSTAAFSAFSGVVLTNVTPYTVIQV